MGLYISGEHRSTSHGMALQCCAHAAGQHQTPVMAAGLALSAERRLMQLCDFFSVVQWCCNKVLQLSHVPVSLVHCCHMDASL